MSMAASAALHCIGSWMIGTPVSQNVEREFFASCLAGMEQLVADELRSNHVKRVRPLSGGVAFFTDRKDALASCLQSRYVARLSMVLGRVDAFGGDAFYAGVHSLPWDGVVKDGATLSVRARGANDALRNTRFTALKAKDAIVDAIREVRGSRPDIAPQGADVRVEIIVHRDKATVSLELGRGRFSMPAHLADADAARAHMTAVSGDGCGYRLISIPDYAGGADREVPVLDEHADQFAARLRKNFKERRKWAAKNRVSCYRIYDADLPDFSVAIDFYGGKRQGRDIACLHVAEYAPPASVDAARAQRRFEDVLALSPLVCGIDPANVFAKVRRREKGGGQYRSEGRANFIMDTFEDELAFEVDLNGYLDTGLFLDHRDTRRMVGQMAAGKRFLNLFAYTGSATVHAAAGGAVETTTVDLSQTYLDWAQRNMEANGFSGRAHHFEKADVMAWITDARRSSRRFDLVFVDPPTFSNSKSMGRRTWDVQRDHVELLIGVSRLLAKDGVAVFSCNLRSFKPDVEKLASYGVSLEDISAQTIPHDFQRNPKIHRCYLARRA